MADPTSTYKLELDRISDQSIVKYLGTLAVADAEKSAALDAPRCVTVTNAVLDGRGYNLEANWDSVPTEGELSFDFSMSEGN